MKRRASEAVPGGVQVIGEHAVEITPLGAGQEVGRSCIILKYQGKSVMFDCGIHPGFTGLNSLPYLDGNEEIDISTVDVALITHFHLDHCAAVPYLLSRTRFKGRVFMTHPTKAIYHSLLKDFARGGKGSADEALYGEEELDASMERIEVVDFMQTLEVAGGIKITPYRAGHVLGAAMFMVEIAGMRALYTGDYSRVPDRHLPAADTPPVTPHIVIVESTYGVSRHLPRLQREELFLQRITDTLRAGGRVLLPVVALGRAQELLLLLDEYWEKHPELRGVPIYQASGQMRRGMRVYETYVEMMNDDIKAVFQHHNPFAFRHVAHLKSAAHFDDVGPCVLMATPSGLQSGASRDAFEAWCEDRHNTVIIVDFAVQGTLAREILGAPKDILTKTGYKKALRCGVAHISFSAHADYDQTSQFLDEVKPPHVVLVHGEKTEMGRLKAALEKSASEQDIPRALYTPANMQTVKIQHQPLRAVRVVGRLAEKPPHEGQTLQGILVTEGLAIGVGSGGPGAAVGAAPQQLLLHPDDLHLYTKLHRGRVTQRQAIATSAPWPALRLALEVMFEGVEGAGTLPVTGLYSAQPGITLTEGAGGGGDDAAQKSIEDGAEGSAVAAAAAGETEGQQHRGGSEGGAGPSGKTVPLPAVRVGDLVTVVYKAANPHAGYEAHVMVEWEGGRVADMVADAVIAVLLQAGSGPLAGSGAGEGWGSAGVASALDGAEAALREARAGGSAEGMAAAELAAVAALVGAQFGPARVDEAAGVVFVEVGAPHLPGAPGPGPGPAAAHAGGESGGAAGMHGAGAGSGPRSEVAGAALPGVAASVHITPGAGSSGVKVVCEDGAVRVRLDKAVRRLLEALRPVCIEV